MSHFYDCCSYIRPCETVKVVLDTPVGLVVSDISDTSVVVSWECSRRYNDYVLNIPPDQDEEISMRFAYNWDFFPNEVSGLREYRVASVDATLYGLCPETEYFFSIVSVGDSDIVSEAEVQRFRTLESSIEPISSERDESNEKEYDISDR